MKGKRSPLPLVLGPLLVGLAVGLVWVYFGKTLANLNLNEERPTGLEDQAPGVDEALPEPGSPEDLLSAGSKMNPGASQGLAGTEGAEESEEDKNLTPDQSAEKSLGKDLALHVKSFFDTPSKDAQGSFVTSSQPVTWSSSCDNKTNSKTFHDLRDHVKAQYTLPVELMPLSVESTEVMHLNQFYSDPTSGLFYQLSLVRGGDPSQGTGYRIERFTGHDVYMNDVQGNEVVLPATRRFDLTYGAAREKFLELVDNLQKANMKMGTRGMVYGKKVPEGEYADASVELTGGKISGFNAPGVSCDGITDKTICDCNAEEEGMGPGGEGFE